MANFVPVNGATGAIYGPSAPTQGDCANAPLSSEPIDLSGLSLDEWVCARTDLTRYARFRVTEANTLPLNAAGFITIEVTAW